MKLLKNIIAVLVIAQVSTAFAQNPSDGCAGVPALPVNTTCTNQAYTLPGSYSNGGIAMSATCVGGNDRDDGWYSVTATSTGTMTIDMTGDRAYGLVIWSSCGGGTEITCDEQNALPGSVSFAATNGTTYYVQVHRRSGNGTATMTGNICAHMPGGGGGNHNIGTGNLTACSGDLFDTGGSGAEYSSSEDITETYCSDVAGQCITITFNSFSTESCCDHLNIYDGPNTGSPLIGTFDGTNSPGTITGTSGCLTFHWTSDGSVTDPGWDATISCSACPTCVDGIQNGLETGIDCGGPSCAPCPCGAGAVPNDEPCCATALTVNPDFLCGTVTSSTIANATQSPESAAACGGTEDDDVWFSFVATGTSHSVDLINIAGSTTDMYHSVWEGPCGGLSLVAGTCSDPNSQTLTGLTPGNTYYVRVYTWTGTTGQTSTFDVCIGTPPPPPANDDCGGAFALTVNPTAACTTVTAGSVASATPSPQATGGCFGTDDDDVWFSFVATGPTHYVSLLNVFGSTTDMYHSVWDGCGGGSSLVPGTCSDGDAQTVTGLTPGNTYYVRVYTYTSTAGQTSSFEVCIGTPPPPPSNDEPCNAIPAVVNPDAVCNLTTPGYCVGSTQTLAGCAGTADDDVWFSFVALDPNQNIEILNATGTTDMVHELFSGPCGSLTSLGCSDPDLSVHTGLTVGATYYVRVYTYSSSGTNTSFDLCITSPCGINGTAPSCNLNYSHSTTAYAPVNYNTGTAMTFTDDRFADAYTSIGFPFCFDGVLYNDVLVSSNGYLIFPGCYSAAPTETSVTAGGYSAYSMYTDAPNIDDAPRNAIMGPWQDIDPSIAGSTVRTRVHGTTPNRVFVAKFNTVGMYSCSSDDFTGQIMLYETTYDIEVHIGEKTICAGWNGGGAILGLHNFDGTQTVIPAGYNYSTPWSVPTGSPEGHRFSNGCPECNTPLPVELVSFRGQSAEGYNLIQWKTITEKNNDYFVLERSTGGSEFEEVAVIEGNGDSNHEIEYGYRHLNPDELQYYRLKQVDFDGAASYSSIISVQSNGSGIKIYPNPTSGKLFFDIENVLKSNEVFTISYTDISGKTVTEQINVSTQSMSYELNEFANLDTGIYIVRFLNGLGEIITTEKVVKQ